jgi:O-glycosyl hydrolase
LTNTIIDDRAIMQGFEPARGVWNWKADANQRWMLQAAEARGANIVVAFANSPPWWMTVSGSVTGGVDGANNLKAGDEDLFAGYLATVVSNLTVRDGIHFNYVTPVNEPSGGWSYDSGKQEGCHISRAQQATVIDAMRAALNTALPSAGVDGPEDYSERDSYNDLVSFSPGTQASIALCTTHTYKADASSDLSAEAAALHKPLWVSEYGDRDATGLTMSQRIHDDIVDMGIQAWVYWQVVDSARGWGFLRNPLTTNSTDGFAAQYTVNKKFYVMGQFSEFIRPGCEIIRVNDANTLAAYAPSNSALTLVAVNTNASNFNVTYNLSAFGAAPWRQAVVLQTASGENLAPLAPLAIHSGKFTAAIPAESVTTFMLTTNAVTP